MFKEIATLIILIQMAGCFLLSKEGGNHTACSSRILTGDKVRQCAVNDGTRMLLEQRNAEWGWGERSEAEAIIALHLANDAWFSKKDPTSYISVKQMNLDLLSAISNNIALTNPAWGHGKLAHYVLGLTATCQDPRNFYGHNLIDKLQNHLNVSSQHFHSNKFAYALVVLALCNANSTVDAAYLKDISTSPGIYTFGVDEAAMVYLAYACVNDAAYSTQSKAALEYILQKRDSKGLYGNEYSTALAVQAIFASNNKSLESLSDAGISFMSNSIDRTNNPHKSMLLSVLPALAKKSYIDVGRTPCMSDIIVTTPPSSKVFLIKITVINNVSGHFNRVWSVSLNEGQTLYNALQNLQAADSSFSFTSTTTTYGQLIRSVCGMDALTINRQYWQMLDSNDTPLSTASDRFFPTDGSSFTLKLTKW
ncbi:transcobalamin-2-like [Mytilus californianus]|uniref:transcobalamin-2-like n=1 Tax=Mytilus californianus TaxID=6549 RepID=UPI002246B79E|nr:transcobalamin-2-like [Mytilus californianus]